MRRKTYCVVLLDEIEKAHPEVFNILLQILEDGRLTDAKGRRVDFRNTIIIMTSNVGAQQLQTRLAASASAPSGDEATRPSADYERMKEKVLGELKNIFRPEFLNRIDATVVFRAADARGDPRDRRPHARAGAGAARRAADGARS